MKKTTRVLVALLALTLVTSCFVGGTFAKYVTTASANDAARVAEFGVVVTANSTAFKAEYAADSTETSIANTVSAEEKVVAPGTEGTLGTSSITGTPEVAVEVKREATLELGDKWIGADDAYYCPLVITVGTTAYNGLDYDSADEFEAAVLADAALVKTTEYAPNTDLSAADSVSVTWAWAYGDFETDLGNDANDTALGDAAAAGNAATIAFSLTTTVTQID